MNYFLIIGLVAVFLVVVVLLVFLRSLKVFPCDAPDFQNYGVNIDLRLRFMKLCPAATRFDVLHNTLDLLGTQKQRDLYHQLARDNLSCWKKSRDLSCEPERELVLFDQDWGVVALKLTKAYGSTFAILNMIDMKEPGGGYAVGDDSREADVFRRTDCHFHLSPIYLDKHRKSYRTDIGRLTNEMFNPFWLDVNHPRVCIKGPEICKYRELANDEVFEFYELKSATSIAPGCGISNEMDTKIHNQFKTLVHNKCRHAIFVPFGCETQSGYLGDFAAMYAKYLLNYLADFDCVAFALDGDDGRYFKEFDTVFRANELQFSSNVS